MKLKTDEFQCASSNFHNMLSDDGKTYSKFVKNYDFEEESIIFKISEVAAKQRGKESDSIIISFNVDKINYKTLEVLVDKKEKNIISELR